MRSIIRKLFFGYKKQGIKMMAMYSECLLRYTRKARAFRLIFYFPITMRIARKFEKRASTSPATR